MDQKAVATMEAEQRLEDAVQDALLVRDAQWQTTVQDALFAACCLLLAAYLSPHLLPCLVTARGSHSPASPGSARGPALRDALSKPALLRGGGGAVVDDGGGGGAAGDGGAASDGGDGG